MGTLSSGDLTVGDVMTMSPRSIEPHQTLETARRWMDDMKVRHLPVRSEGRIVGVISDRDINLLAGVPGFSHTKSTVEDAMISSVRTVSRSTKIRDVAREMLEHRIGCVIVTEKDENLVGIFTDTDALALLAGIR